MLKNYLLLALKVLRRKPFYTFISLFGISFTLMILMLVTSMFDAMLGANKPMTDLDRYLFVPMIERTRSEIDTVMTVDTLAMDSGQMRYDTSYAYNSEVTSNSNGPASYQFLKKNLSNLDAAESYTFFAPNGYTDGFLDGVKFTFSTYYTDAAYWDVFDFDFLFGLPYSADDEQQANKVLVMTEKAAKIYFGELNKDLIGREVRLGEETFRVKGIVRRPLSEEEAIAGDVFMPVTTIDPRQYDSPEVYGSFNAVFKAKTPEGREALKKEITFIGENYQMPPDDYYEKVELFSGTFMEKFAGQTLQERDTAKALRLLFIPVFLLLFLFVVLPVINLVNLNISRVYERQSEIGVRKAFGADSRDILLQFIFENLVLTFIGGMIGVALAAGVIYYVNVNDLLGVARLSFSLKVFLYFLVVILLFGLVSGILPAYRMSRSSISNALR